MISKHALLKGKLTIAALFAAVVVLGAPHVASAQEGAATAKSTAAPPSLWMDALTWPEISIAIQQGYKTIIIPTAGIEQNGPHIPLNKHRLVVEHTTERIAKRLGHTLIAPVIDHVPEGDIHARDGHMLYPGTISMPPKVFADILEYTARSLHAHGFEIIFFVGDSGGNQSIQKKVANRLQSDDIDAFHIGRYYANAQQEKLLARHGFSKEAIGGHAGLRDTSEYMYVRGDAIRADRLDDFKKEDYQAVGAYGNAARANPSLGSLLVQMKVDEALADICKQKGAYDICH